MGAGTIIERVLSECVSYYSGYGNVNKALTIDTLNIDSMFCG